MLFVEYLFILFKNTLLLHLLKTAVLAGASDEYCDTEVFRAECGESEVILMERALYGRMKVGRCVETDMGYLGCATDVLLVADRRCSGRRMCELRVPDGEFEETNPCLKELKTYLEASYTCVKVETPLQEQCIGMDKRDDVNVTSQSHGYIISSATMSQMGCNMNRRAWVVRAEKGQRINLTLYDFSLHDISGIAYHLLEQEEHNHKQALIDADIKDNRLILHPSSSLLSSSSSSSSHSSSSSSNSPQMCRQYAEILDSQKSTERRPVCAQQQRIKNIYTSLGHVVHVWLTPIGYRHSPRFMIEYNVIGCPDPILPDRTWFIRSTDFQGVMGCEKSDVTWTVLCQEGTWIQVSPVNCSTYLSRVLERSTMADIKQLSPSAESMDSYSYLSNGRQAYVDSQEGIMSVTDWIAMIVSATVMVSIVCIIIIVITIRRRNKFAPPSCPDLTLLAPAAAGIELKTNTTLCSDSRLYKSTLEAPHRTTYIKYHPIGQNNQYQNPSNFGSLLNSSSPGHLANKEECVCGDKCLDIDCALNDLRSGSIYRDNTVPSTQYQSVLDVQKSCHLASLHGAH